MSEVVGPVNVTRVPQMSSLDEVAAFGVARVSWALGLFRQSMAHFKEQLASVRD